MLKPIQVVTLTLFAACAAVKDTSHSQPLGNGLADGNNGDGFTVAENPWFVGDRTVKYCVDFNSDNMSTTAEEASDVIADVLQDWVATIDHLPVDADSTRLVLGGSEKSLALSFTRVTCDDETDLTFKLGSFDDSVEGILALSAKRVGFARMTAHDLSTGWSRGYIWLAPDRGDRKYEAGIENFWSDRSIVSDVLLHEVGHVFGFRHEADTFMWGKFPALRVTTATPPDASPLSSKVLVARGKLVSNTHRETEICAKVVSFFEADLVRITGTDDAAGICLRDRQFEITSATGDVIAAYDYGTSGQSSSSIRPIQGLYPKAEGEYEWYNFAEYVSESRRLFSVQFPNETVPMIMELSWNGYHLTMFKDGRWRDIEFYDSELDSFTFLSFEEAEEADNE